MKRAIATAALLAAAGPACAQAVTLKPLVDARLRNEAVHQDGIARDAEALTIRLRAGVQASAGVWSALVEGQGNLAAIDHYYDGVNGRATRPQVGDPENIALYRAQLQYKTKALAVTVGRQRIVLDDERFVGAANFRNNGQTFDAVRMEWTGLKKLKLDLSYVTGLRTIWGIEGMGARQQAVSGDSVLANLSYVTPVGTLTGFAYLIDQDEAAVQGYRQSSQTYGVRLAGNRALSGTTRLSWQLSHARQGDYHRNPNDYHADYWLADATLDLGALKLNGGYEVLGADRGVALTSFQTPLSSVFKFQGWADKFVTTPANGVRDLYGSAGYGWKKIGRIDAVTVQAVYHDFRSDRLDQHQGSEWDLLATAKMGRTLFSVRYADYHAEAFAVDTRKLWLQADWIF